MIWFAIVPAVWIVVSGVLGVLIGRCIGCERSDEAEWATTVAAAAFPIATATVSGSGAGAEAAEDISPRVGADAACTDDDGAPVRDRSYAGAR